MLTKCSERNINQMNICTYTLVIARKSGIVKFCSTNRLFTYTLVKKSLFEQCIEEETCVQSKINFQRIEMKVPRLTYIVYVHKN